MAFLCRGPAYLARRSGNADNPGVHMKLLRNTMLVSLMFSFACAPAIAQGPPPHLPAEALADAPDTARAEFLKSNVVVDGPVSGGLSFRFPDAFYEGRLFLLGESHGSAAPQVLDLELLTHLNRRIGLVDYVAEVDPVQALWLNRYLASGDEDQMDRVFDLWNGGSQWANVPFEDKLRGIRSLNRSLPDGRGITLHGIDAIQDWPLLIELLRGRGVDIDEEAMTAASSAAERARIALDALRGSGLDMPALSSTLQHQAEGLDREATIFRNYAELVGNGTLGDRPAYGLWGAAHVLQAPVHGKLRFAGQVAESDLPTASKVRSIVVYALDSAVQFPVPLPQGVARVKFNEGNVDGPVVKLDGSATLRAASEPGRITVFGIDPEGSPYRHGQQLVALKSSMDPGIVPSEGVPTTGYMQYVGVYRGSDWAEPREGSGPIIGP